MTPLDFNDLSCDILRALRAGDMDLILLQERFGYAAYLGVTQLKAAGYVQTVDTDRVGLTALGRENCPPRNPVLLKAFIKKHKEKLYGHI